MISSLENSRQNNAMDQPRQLVLASTSKYRRELLERLGLRFETAGPDCDESALHGEPAPEPALRTVQSLRDFVVENAKSARAFLAAVGMPCAIRELNITPLEHDVAPLLKPLQEGRPLGLLSEAGCPAIADPGAALVEAAHHAGFRV